MDFVDGQSICSGYAPRVSKQTVLLKGTIPRRFRHNNKNRINIIKITDKNSNTSYIANVNQDDFLWEKEITFDFSNTQQAVVVLEGYNDSSLGQVLHSNQLNIYKDY